GSRTSRSSAESSRARSRYGLSALQRVARMRGLIPGVRFLLGPLLHQVVEEQARPFPVALHGAVRKAAHGGDLGERESTEELEVDELGQGRIDRRQLVHCVADAFQLLVV